MYGHVITKFSRIGSLPHFFTHGAPLRASRARAPLKNLKKWRSVPCKQSLLSLRQAMLLEMETLFTLMRHDFSNDLHESTKTFIPDR